MNKAAPILAFIFLHTPLVGQTLYNGPLPTAPQFFAAASTSQIPAVTEPHGVSNPCSFHGLFRHAEGAAREFGRGVVSAPRNAIRPANLKWELPIAASTGILIAEGDQPLANRILHGSDFPVPVLAHWALLQKFIGWRDFIRCQRISNLLERDYQLKKAIGFGSESFSIIRRLLRPQPALASERQY